MAQLAVLIAGLLLIVESQASDVAEAHPSAVQDFLSKYMTAPMQRGALKHGNEGTGPFVVIDDKPALHPAPQMQDSFAFTSAKDVMDAHLTEHTMLAMAISSMAVVHNVHSIVAGPNMGCRAKGAHAKNVG